jgi:hypothetical protein
VLILLSIFQLSHAIGSVLLAGAAGSILLLAYFDPPNRRQLLWHFAWIGTLLLLAFIKIKISSNPNFPSLYDSYAAEEATWEKAMERWDKGVAGAPIEGLKFIYAAGGLVLVHTFLRGPRLKWVRIGLTLVILACIGIAGMTWLKWASDQHAWALCIDDPILRTRVHRAICRRLRRAPARKRSLVTAPPRRGGHGRSVRSRHLHPERDLDHALVAIDV